MITDDQIRDKGGDPDCLHCRLSALLLVYCDQNPQFKDPPELIAALSEILGDMISRSVTLAVKIETLREATALMAGRCGIGVDSKPSDRLQKAMKEGMH